MGGEKLYPSPLRIDPQPMDGIYHTTFVTARMYRAVKCLVESGVLNAVQKEQALKELEANARLFRHGFATVREHGKLTPLGADVIQNANAYMSGNA